MNINDMGLGDLIILSWLAGAIFVLLRKRFKNSQSTIEAISKLWFRNIAIILLMLIGLLLKHPNSVLLWSVYGAGSFFMSVEVMNSLMYTSGSTGRI